MRAFSNVASKDVVACLRDAGLDLAEEVKSKRDLAKISGGCGCSVCHSSFIPVSGTPCSLP